jgi:hypothetical protein
MTNKTIQQHIDDDRNELDNLNLNGQRRRHLEGELESLEKYRETHPEDDHDPTPLELYCNDNPNALECRIYGD